MKTKRTPDELAVYYAEKAREAKERGERRMRAIHEKGLKAIRYLERARGLLIDLGDADFVVSVDSVAKELRAAYPEDCDGESGEEA